MSSPAVERSVAVAVADGTCPRCGSARAADQRYCLSCGLALPLVTGRVPAWRRRWIGRVGWYPGDWIWTSLAALAVAAAATAGAIVLSDRRAERGPGYVAVAPTVPVAEPVRPAPTTTAAPTTHGDTSTLPTAPEPRAGAPGGPRITWPAGASGWTIVLVSYPKTVGGAEARATAREAAKAGLLQVGIIDSSRYASLQPGYLVVFTGVYGSKADADAAVSTARQAGFAGAYSREIAP